MRFGCMVDAWILAPVTPDAINRYPLMSSLKNSVQAASAVLAPAALPVIGVAQLGAVVVLTGCRRVFQQAPKAR